VAGSRRARLALAGVCSFVVVLGAWNVLRYPPGFGYDAAAHIAYADGLVPGGKLPHGTGEFHIPPGYYALAGSLDWVARKLGAGEPHRAGMAVNVLFLLGTVLLVWRLAGELWPGRTRLAVAAVAFVALVPVTVKAEAMFHPELMSTFLCTLALWLGVRTFASRAYEIPLGLTLGAAQLVRAFALWTVASVAIALALGRRWRELAVVLALAAVVPAAWYVHQDRVYGTPLAFNRPTPSKPFLERRPLRFYVDPGLPAAITRPYRPHFTNLAIPTAYTEMWGDYFGVWAWTSPAHPPRHELELQSLVGIVPTLLAVGGWIGLLAASWRSPPRLVVALLPAIGLAGFLYFTVGHPSNDGDVIKATYLLTTTAGWALGFGWAFDRLRGGWLVAATALVGLSALLELPFLVY
jgi:Dolichyl-phosphate-mannose-protein mannosyltransferase